MKTAFETYRAELDAIREAGTYKSERIITTPSAPVSIQQQPTA